MVLTLSKKHRKEISRVRTAFIQKFIGRHQTNTCRLKWRQLCYLKSRNAGVELNVESTSDKYVWSNVRNWSLSTKKHHLHFLKFDVRTILNSLKLVDDFKGNNDYIYLLNHNVLRITPS